MKVVYKLDEIKDTLRTGDLILFDSRASYPLRIFDWLVKAFTSSNYNHIAMVLKDPYFLAEVNQGVDKEMFKGIFVWESSWEGEPDPQDGKVKLGVQVTELQQVLKSNGGTAYIRKLSCPLEQYEKTFTDGNLKNIHKIVYDKPYDINPIDWISALFRVNFTPKKISTFWCSALVGVIYNKLGIIKDNIDWTIMRPSDFSLEDKNKHIIFNENFQLAEYQIQILGE